MFMTVLAGKVAQENWAYLQDSFEKMCRHPPVGLVEIELVQSVEEPSDWQLVVLWTSQEAFEEATRGHQTPPCEQMFCDAGSVPRRAKFKLVTRYQRV